MEQECAVRPYLLLQRPHLADLVGALQGAGYAVVGPTVRDGVIIYDTLSSVDDLPVGWTDVQERGQYRLERRADDAIFAHAVGPQSWKKFLHLSRLSLWKAHRKNGGFTIESADDGPVQPLALFGMRACDLRALAIQDRVLDAPDGHPDPHYVKRRRGAFVVAVNCSQPAATCFCSSMGCGPDARGGYDLSLTELIGGTRHDFLVHVRSEAGREMMQLVPHAPASLDDVSAAGDVIRHATHNIRRRIDMRGLGQTLAANADHPHWDDIARRCLACTNCTMVCPTCYCTNVNDVTDLTGQSAERVRTWDSCFTTEFSYIHGGSVRPSIRSRYRHFLTHKLSSWEVQFRPTAADAARADAPLAAGDNASCCVGCGRCITWCPVGIDLTQEVATIQSIDSQAIAAQNDRRRIVPMQTIDMRKLLSDHPFLRGMDRRHVEALADCSVLKRFGAGEFLFAEGQEANNSYLIVSGRVELEVYVPGRGPICVGTVEPGGVIGWSWLMNPFRWHFDAHATQTTEAVVLDGQALRAYCEMWHDLGYDLFKRYSVVFQERIESLRMQLLDVYGVHPTR